MRRAHGGDRETPVLTGPEHVVHEAEHPEAEADEQDQRPGEVESGLVAETHGAERGPTRFDDEHRRDDQHATDDRDAQPSVVLTQQRGRGEDLVTGHDQEPHRHEPDDERDDDRHP